MLDWDFRLQGLGFFLSRGPEGLASSSSSSTSASTERDAEEY